MELAFSNSVRDCVVQRDKAQGQIELATLLKGRLNKPFLFVCLDLYSGPLWSFTGEKQPLMLFLVLIYCLGVFSNNFPRSFREVPNYQIYPQDQQKWRSIPERHRSGVPVWPVKVMSLWANNNITPIDIYQPFPVFILSRLTSLEATLVWNYDPASYLLTGVGCRATSVAKKITIVSPLQRQLVASQLKAKKDGVCKGCQGCKVLSSFWKYNFHFL